MPTFRNGLCKLGETYLYCFRVRGQQFKGSTRATDRTTAEKVLQEKRREAVLRLQTGYVEPPTVAVLLNQWVAAHQQVLSPAHILNTRRLMAKWVLPTLADTRIDRVKTSAVMGIRSRVLEAGRTLSTANLVTRTIKLLWNFALRLDYLEKLPFQTPVAEIQGMLGHKQIQTTMIYVEQSLDAKRRAQDALSQKLGLGYGVDMISIECGICRSDVEPCKTRCHRLEEVVDEPRAVSVEVLHPECRVMCPKILGDVVHASNNTLAPQHHTGTFNGSRVVVTREPSR